MGVLVVLVLWLVLGIALVFPPLLGWEKTPLYEQSPWLAKGETDERAESPESSESIREETASGQPITDGGHRCHNCGATMDPEYTYCGECLMPRL